MEKVLIFGGGISGLTIAHELCHKGIKCLVIEKEDIFGGMARSDSSRTEFPSEHSWRGYAPFYKNVFQIMKEIPYYDKTVFDNLSIPINFFLMYDDIKQYDLTTNFSDNLILFLLGLLYIFSDKRYYSYKIEPFLKKYLSKNGYDYIVNFIIGPGYGMDKEDISMGHLLKFPIISYVQTNHGSASWQVTNGPTNDTWFDPWVEYLSKKGVRFLNNTELISLDVDGLEIVSCWLKNKDNVFTLKADDYILALNPYAIVDIMKKSSILDLYNKFKYLTKDTRCKQISFRIGIDRKIEYPIDNIGFVMNDSEFNITWYPQEKFWDTKPSIGSLWSGTIIDFKTKGKLYGKNAEHLDKDKLKKEIIHQILRSKSFQKMIYDKNGVNIHEKDIHYFEIWHEWNFIEGKQEQKNKKWVNNIYNEKYRPGQTTKYSNLFLSGAHTKTSVNIWSMEGAVESGKLTSNIVLAKYGRKKALISHHTDNIFIRLFQKIDNILYYLNFPNVIITLAVITILLPILKQMQKLNHL